MLEIRQIPQGLFGKDGGLLHSPKFVLINKFTDESYKEFLLGCDRVLNTGQDFLPIVIDSYGGYVYSLLAMIDFLMSLDVRIITVCEGKAMSCGAVLFACGEERYAGENSTLMVHDVSNTLWGKDVELQNDAKETSRLNRKIYSLLDKNTKQKKGYWRSLIRENKYADFYMTAKAAKKHDLVTEIGIPHIETRLIIETQLLPPSGRSNKV